MPPTRVRLGGLIKLGILAGLLAACLLTVRLAQAAPLPSASVSITSTSISVSGAGSSGAVNVITETADGLKEPDTVFVLLKAGVSVAEAEAFLATNRTGDPNTVGRIGSIVFNAEARAGSTTEAQTTLLPGTYVALNAEGQRSSKWTRTSFNVSASATPGVLAIPAAIERTIDFSFTGPKTLHRGELVRFENEGYVVHMNMAFPARDKQSAERLARALRLGHERVAEKLTIGRPVSFAGPLSSGGLQQERITGRPGWYVQVCFMAAQDHRPHTLLGMERLVRIAP